MTSLPANGLIEKYFFLQIAHSISHTLKVSLFAFKLYT